MHYSPHIARSEDQTRLVKKASIVHFQGIGSSPSKAEADKHPCCLWTEANLANQCSVFRSVTLKRRASWEEFRKNRQKWSRMDNLDER